MTTQEGDYPKLIAVSDSALLIEFDNQISSEINDRVIGLKNTVDGLKLYGVEESVAGYRSLLVHYNCMKIPLAELKQKIVEHMEIDLSASVNNKTWRVPVNYRGAGAIDLEDVARLHKLSTDEVIRCHQGSDFRVFMVGFAPGWCYLGGLDCKIATPRLPSPRLQVPDGCISIGGQQGMIGGQAMPSGWRLIGQTPVQTYAAKRKPPFFIGVGDRIQFYEVHQREYDQLQRAANRGELVAQEVR